MRYVIASRQTLVESILVSKLTLCEKCNGTGRRGLIGGTRAYRTCEVCEGTGRVIDQPVASAKPSKDPRRRHTEAEARRRLKHGGAG